MSTRTLLIIILVLALCGAFPAWPYASTWGYGPLGILLIVLFVVILVKGEPK